MKHVKPIAVLAALVLLAMSSLTGCAQKQAQPTQEPQEAPVPQLITPPGAAGTGARGFP